MLVVCETYCGDLFMFCVYRWLDSGEDDGLIQRQLDVVHYVQTPPPHEPLEREPGYCGYEDFIYSFNLIDMLPIFTLSIF